MTPSSETSSGGEMVCNVSIFVCQWCIPHHKAACPFLRVCFTLNEFSWLIFPIFAAVFISISVSSLNIVFRFIVYSSECIFVLISKTCSCLFVCLSSDVSLGCLPLLRVCFTLKEFSWLVCPILAAVFVSISVSSVNIWCQSFYYWTSLRFRVVELVEIHT